MSHSVHPYSHRLGIIKDWKSRWFSSGQKYKDFLRVDMMLREFLEKKMRGQYVGAIEMERNDKTFRLIIKTSRPGVVIGRSGEGSITGTLAVNTLQRFYFDKLFLSASSIDAEKGISDYNLEDATIKQTLINNSKEIIAVIDSSKFNKIGLVKIAELNQINTLITDTKPSQKLHSKLTKYGVRLIIAE